MTELDELFDAIEDGDVDWVIDAFEDGYIQDPDAGDADGYTALIMAAHLGQLEILDVLLEYNADPIFIANDGCSALLCAVNGGYVDCITLLLEHKNSHVNPKPDDQRVPSPLYTASQNGDGRIVTMLLEAKAEVDHAHEDTTPLSIAAQEGYPKIVRQLIAAGANVNRVNKNQASPLFLAARNGHANIVQQLLMTKEILVDAPTADGTTPLLISIQIGNLQETELLIEAGADVEKADKAGHTPLLSAAHFGDLDMIETLVEEGANLNSKDPETGMDPAEVLRTEFGEDLMKIVARFRPDAVPAKPVAEETVDETPVPAPSDEEGPVAAPTADSQEAKSSKKKRHKHKHKHKHRRRKKSEKGAGVEPQQDDKGLHELLTAVAKDLFEEYDANKDKALQQTELRKMLVYLGCEERLGADNFNKHLEVWFKQYTVEGAEGLDFEHFLTFYCYLMGEYKKMKRTKRMAHSSEAHETKKAVLKVTAGSRQDKKGRRKKRRSRHRRKSSDGAKKSSHHRRRKRRKHKHAHSSSTGDLASDSPDLSVPSDTVHAATTGALPIAGSMSPKGGDGRAQIGRSISHSTSLAGLPKIPNRHRVKQESGDAMRRHPFS